jgi:predicted ATPase
MWETLALLATLPSVTRIDLAGLPVADTAEMIRSATGTAPSAEVAMAVHRQTDGNAFYALELGRLLGSEGSLDDLDRSKRAGIPDSVRDVLRRRLTRLPEQAVAVLNIAAVLGGDIEPRVVQQVSGLDLDTIADQFELATVSGLVREHPSRMGVYRFAHQLVRAAVVDTLPGLRRANLHARAVEAIVAVHGDDDPRHTHELARHAHRAAVVTGPRPAIDRLMRSALQARSMLDLERATNAFGLAASLVVDLPDGPERTGLDAMISMRIAQAHLLLHGYSAIVEAGFSRSLALSRSASSDARVDGLAGFG